MSETSKDEITIELFIEKVSLILNKVLEDGKTPRITPDTKLVNGVGQNDFDLSSIDYVDFIVLLEKEFDFVFYFDINLNTIGDFYSYILNQKKEAQT